MFNTIKLAAVAITLAGATLAAGRATADQCCYGAPPNAAVGKGTCCLCGMSPAERAQWYSWHGNYAHSAFGQPVALVVPPTANLQTNWGWGVGSSRISRIDHQFGRNYPGPGPFGSGFMMTPRWPHDTTNFGVYSVRGPW